MCDAISTTYDVTSIQRRALILLVPTSQIPIRRRLHHRQYEAGSLRASAVSADRQLVMQSCIPSSAAPTTPRPDRLAARALEERRAHAGVRPDGRPRMRSALIAPAGTSTVTLACQTSVARSPNCNVSDLNRAPFIPCQNHIKH